MQDQLAEHIRVDDRAHVVLFVRVALGYDLAVRDVVLNDPVCDRGAAGLVVVEDDYVTCLKRRRIGLRRVDHASDRYRRLHAARDNDVLLDPGKTRHRQSQACDYRNDEEDSSYRADQFAEDSASVELRLAVVHRAGLPARLPLFLFRLVPDSEVVRPALQGRSVFPGVFVLVSFYSAHSNSIITLLPGPLVQSSQAAAAQASTPCNQFQILHR